MDPEAPTRHRANLSVSADHVPLGHSATLTWQVIGVTAAVASVHLATGNEDGAHMIEAAPPGGSREVIFAHPGVYTFTLTATFGDGVKLSRQVNVHVTG